MIFIYSHVKFWDSTEEQNRTGYLIKEEPDAFLFCNELVFIWLENLQKLNQIEFVDLWKFEKEQIKIIKETKPAVYYEDWIFQLPLPPQMFQKIHTISEFFTYFFYYKNDPNEIRFEKTVEILENSCSQEEIEKIKQFIMNHNPS